MKNCFGMSRIYSGWIWRVVFYLKIPEEII